MSSAGVRPEFEPPVKPMGFINAFLNRSPEAHPPWWVEWAEGRVGGRKRSKEIKTLLSVCPLPPVGPARCGFLLSLSLSLSLFLAVLLPAPVLTCEVDRGASVIVVALVSQAR